MQHIVQNTVLQDSEVVDELAFHDRFLEDLDAWQLLKMMIQISFCS